MLDGPQIQGVLLVVFDVCCDFFDFLMFLVLVLFYIISLCRFISIALALAVFCAYDKGADTSGMQNDKCH